MHRGHLTGREGLRFKQKNKNQQNEINPGILPSPEPSCPGVKQTVRTARLFINVSASHHYNKASLSPVVRCSPSGVQLPRICAGTAFLLPHWTNPAPATCTTFDMFGKSCHLVTEARPRGGHAYQKAPGRRRRQAARVTQKVKTSDLIIPVVEQQPEAETLSQDDFPRR